MHIMVQLAKENKLKKKKKERKEDTKQNGGSTFSWNFCSGYIYTIQANLKN